MSTARASPVVVRAVWNGWRSRGSSTPALGHARRQVAEARVLQARIDVRAPPAGQIEAQQDLGEVVRFLDGGGRRALRRETRPPQHQVRRQSQPVGQRLDRRHAVTAAARHRDRRGAAQVVVRLHVLSHPGRHRRRHRIGGHARRLPLDLGDRAVQRRAVARRAVHLLPQEAGAHPDQVASTDHAHRRDVLDGGDRRALAEELRHLPGGERGDDGAARRGRAQGRGRAGPGCRSPARPPWPGW